MGCTLSSNENERDNDLKIDNEVQNGVVIDKEKRTNKILLLSAGHAGTSTIFKSLRLIHGETFMGRELTEVRQVIRANCVQAMLALLQCSAVNLCQYIGYTGILYIIVVCSIPDTSILCIYYILLLV